ncbi:Levansucrase [Pseudomonas savastanoi pv. fraxini]|nr:Levansucrase [Pseudomonas savastanoi pv. fraxini]RMR70808.1 Levansucrase [Pseudomonas savastanoi pv. fraxini]
MQAPIKDIIMSNINYAPTIWSRADALKVNENDPTTTQPLVSPDFPVMSDTVFIWDTMPLRELDGPWFQSTAGR